MYGHFTEQAKKAISISQESAAALGHRYVGTEHLLLGLVQESTGAAARVLQKQGVTEEKVAKAIIEMIGTGRGNSQPPPGFTPKTKKVLAMSFREGISTGHSFIGIEHLLLGILKESESIAVRVLVNLGIDPHGLSVEILKLFDTEATETAGSAEDSGRSAGAGQKDARRAEIS